MVEVKRMPKGFWFCPNCNCYKAPEEITHEETCQDCNWGVEWREEPLWIVAFDPGKTIGYAVFCNTELFRLGHLQSIEELVRELYRQIGTPNLRVVYEGFARGNTAVKDQLQTIEICGAIQAIALACEFPVKSQYPSMRTGYIPIAKAMIQEKGFTLSEMKHAVDAIAHGLAYMDKEGLGWQKQDWIRKALPRED